MLRSLTRLLEYMLRAASLIDRRRGLGLSFSPFFLSHG